MNENENLNRTRNELSIIGVLLDDNKEYSGEIESCYAKMQPKHFYTPALAFAYDVMRSVYRGQGRTATINEIMTLCKGKNEYSGLDEILLKAMSEADTHRSLLESLCDAVHKDFVNDRLISLTTEETAANELYNRLNELINDYDDYNNSIDEKKANVLEYITSGKFKNDVDRQINAKDIPTGFQKLDENLGSKNGKKGLFPERLYVIGAVPSLGKTTLVHQIADNIAESGTPVLFFSLEQSENELVLKSIVREQHKARIKNGKKSLKSDVNTILKMLLSGIDQSYIQDAIEAYKATAANMYIYEGNFNTTINTIRATAKRFIRANRKTPVIIVDYLQILKPANDKIKDPIAIVDENITALKVLARETHTAVFVISSLSRKGYETDSSYTALKGSGSIEYSADTVFSLSLDIGNKETYSEVFKQMNKDNCRRLKLECLKNRGGQSTFTCYFSYNPQYEYFEEKENEREKPKDAS